ncbi:unnamed protein product [Dimorphilus gyrociliatus]|uniref:Uncharacterized protein n=1 Tax=Dimorphilus gyrociliatus TaxID=2664684 RepID=A0A7I8W9D7_9ANNE|nr:unnamed protein product [Dimorphilus gyrociliatus]
MAAKLKDEVEKSTYVAPLRSGRVLSEADDWFTPRVHPHGIGRWGRGEKNERIGTGNYQEQHMPCLLESDFTATTIRKSERAGNLHRQTPCWSHLPPPNVPLSGRDPPHRQMHLIYSSTNIDPMNTPAKPLREPEHLYWARYAYVDGANGTMRTPPADYKVFDPWLTRP